MRRVFVLLLLVTLVGAIPLLAQEATSEATPEPTVDPVTMADVAPDAEATAEPGGANVATAHIRIAHLSPDTPPLQVFIGGELSDIQIVAFPDVTGWVEVPVGTYSIALVPIEEGLEQAVIGPLDLSFGQGAWITIAAIGSLEEGTLTAQLIAERYGQIPLNQARLTLFHAIEGAPAVDVVLNDTLIPVQGLDFTGEFTADVAADTYDVKVVASGTEDVLLELTDLQLNAGSFYFVGVTGTADAPQLVLAEVQSGLVANFLQDVSGTIIDTLEADGRFTMLLSAIEAAGLTETLNGAGPFTIFAPTDAAFASVPQADLDGLLSDPDRLTDVLLYHVAEGTMTSQDVVGTTSIVTLQGSSVAVALNDRGAFLNDTAQIIIVDAPATNGVIHAINAVLMPPGAAETVTMDEAEAAPEATEAP